LAGADTPGTRSALTRLKTFSHNAIVMHESRGEMPNGRIRQMLADFRH